jgi:hypothetical protein
MNLEREAYLNSYQRQFVAEEHNHNVYRPTATHPPNKINHVLRLMGQIRGIHIHISFDLKEPVDQIRRANA